MPKSLRVREFGDRNLRLVPLDAPYPPKSKGGRHRLPEATRWMRAVIKLRQDIEAEFLDSEGVGYDWKNELSKRWYPGVNGHIYVRHNGKTYP